MYKIAEYFPEQCRIMASELSYGPNIIGKYPRTKHGFCPIGAMLLYYRDGMYDGDIYIVAMFGDPIPRIAMNDMRKLGLISDDLNVVEQLEEFMNDWDSGKIINLKEALGVSNL